MGSADLFDYTVLGDTVNLASRLENANKQFGTSILISGSTYQEVAGKVNVRPLGKINVKGKTEQIAVYELLSLLPPRP
jgi:adenylate cyclase